MTKHSLYEIKYETQKSSYILDSSNSSKSIAVWREITLKTNKGSFTVGWEQMVLVGNSYILDMSWGLLRRIPTLSHIEFAAYQTFVNDVYVVAGLSLPLDDATFFEFAETNFLNQHCLLLLFQQTE